MKRKFAVPSTNGLLDPHFGHCRSFTLIDTENTSIVSVDHIDAPPHQPGLLPAWIAEKGVSDVIAGGMGQRAIQLFNTHSVNVFVGAPVQSPEQLVYDFLNGRVSFSANYCDH